MIDRKYVVQLAREQRQLTSSTLMDFGSSAGRMLDRSARPEVLAGRESCSDSPNPGTRARGACDSIKPGASAPGAAEAFVEPAEWATERTTIISSQRTFHFRHHETKYNYL